ncbi:AMP-binding protein [Rickettsiella endosymbiont of Miltochrista miniata]|uniref:AMP-binding protein n=1 Tax=Rickettsiella endosymbiont of Miltochrista miniata TaxID=3066239 RepID=UPI00313DB0CF
MMEKIWLNRYQQQVPAEINPDIYQSLDRLFADACEKFHSLPALSFFQQTISYGRWAELSCCLAAYLQQQLKLSKGTKVALMLPNCPQYMISIFAVLQAGLVVTNVNPFYTEPEFTQQIDHSQAEVLIVLNNFLPNIIHVLKNTHVKYVITTHLGDMLTWPRSWLINVSAWWSIKNRKQKNSAIVPIDFLMAIKIGQNLTLSSVVIKREDLAFLQYTGGTTGAPKGAMLTHRNMLANIEQLTAWVRPILHEGQEIFITALPLYHIFSLMVNGLMCVRLGGTNCLIPDARNIKRLIQTLAKTPFSTLLGVNTLFKALLRHKAFTKLDFRNLKIALGGGAPLQSTVKVCWKQITGKLLFEGYGLTEASPVVCAPPWDLVVAGDHVGLPLPSTNIRLCDAKKNEVGLGEIGELCVKGPQVMQDYWMQAADVEYALTTDGWLLTGDLARIDHQGFVYIIGRKKELILVSGFNVYPEEIEQVIQQNPKVKEVAVIGVPSDKTGEAIKAFVVRKDESLTAEELLNYCRAALTSYKLPHEIKFLNHLPKSALGKILKKNLH